MDLLYLVMSALPSFLLVSGSFEGKKLTHKRESHVSRSNGHIHSS